MHLYIWQNYIYRIYTCFYSIIWYGENIMMIMFLLPLSYALTMNLKTKKVPEYFFWKLQIVLVELYNHYWPWNKICWRSLLQDSREGAEKAGCSVVKATKKAESVFEEVGTEPKNSRQRAWEDRVWSQKCWKVRGYCKIDGNYYFLWNYQQKSFTYAVNIISPYV